MPDRGFCGDAETSSSRFISDYFTKESDAPVPLGFQLSWKLRLGEGHVIRSAQSEAGLLPEADIPLDESMPRSCTRL